VERGCPFGETACSISIVPENMNLSPPTDKCDIVTSDKYISFAKWQLIVLDRYLFSCRSVQNLGLEENAWIFVPDTGQ
jgi:hypothetical protein